VTLYKIDGPRWMESKSEEEIALTKSLIMDGIYVYEGENIHESVTHVIRYSGEILTKEEYISLPKDEEDEEE
jgi:hypothetical protein